MKNKVSSGPAPATAPSASDGGADDRELLRATIARLLDEHPAAERARQVGPTGVDLELWDRLVALGLVAMAAPVAAGGGGASLADLAVVAAELGRRVAAVPALETFVALRLAARLGVADAELAELVEGGAVLGVALSPTADAADAADSVAIPLVPGAAAADRTLVRVGDEARWLAGPAVEVASELAIGPVGDVVTGEGDVVVAQGPEVARAWAAAWDEWRVLAAAHLVGVGQGALDLAVRYVQERHAFGGPLARFQVIQHRLADRATELAGAELLVARAVAAVAADGSVDGEQAEAQSAGSPLAPMAHWFAGDVAERASAESLHLHGGYGFMTEYDVQLHLRRAKGLRLLVGDPGDELAEVADRLALEGTSAAVPHRPISGDEAFRAQVRAFVAERATPEIIERAHATGTLHDDGLHRAIAERGWLATWWAGEGDGEGEATVGGPAGGAIGPAEVVVLMEELQRAGAPVDGTGIAMMVATTLRHVGSPTQLAEVLPRILAGDLLPCLGYSEPDAGSDVAAATTKAVRDGDTWVITGQKMFTTLAEEADVVFLLARTDASGPKHRGLTLFLVPMGAAGVEVRAVETLGGERTNITFYEGVQVPDAARVGPVGEGWSVMSVALAFERNSAVLGSALRLYDLAWAWAATGAGPDGAAPMARPDVRRALARVAVDLEVADVLGARALELTAAGEVPVVEGSMTKLFTTERYQAASSALLDALGADGVRAHGSPGAPADGWIEHAFRHAVVTTIAAGTSEIQREIIAQRGLGLPRSR
jgi:alkylation response protein AidB-like acyl-CoA dehydrogenase